MNIKRLIKASKELSSISAGYFSMAIGGLLGVRILTAFLTPSQYGQLSLGLTMGGVIYSVFFGPMTNGMARFISIAREKKQIRIYLYTIFKLFFKTSTLISFFSLLIIIIILLTDNLRWINLALASIAFGFIFSFNNIFIGLQIALRNRLLVSFNQGLITFSKFLLALVLIKIFGPSGTVALYGQVFGLAIVLFIQIYQTIKIIKKYDDHDIVKISQVNWQSKVIIFARPLITIGFLNWLKLSAEKWGLLFFTNYDEAVGYFSIVYQFGYYPIALLTNLLINYLRPIYFDRAGNNKKNLISTYVLGIKIFIIVFCIFAFLISLIFLYREFFLSILLDEKYRSVSYLIGIMMMSALLNESTSFVTLLMQTKKETKPLIIPNGISYTTGLILTILGAYFYGLYGVVMASLLNSLLKFLSFSLLCRNHYKQLII